MIASKLTKLLALSFVCSVLVDCGSANAETACVKPVRFYGKLNIVGSKTNYKAYLNLRKMLQNLKLIDNNGLLQNFKKVDKNEIKYTLKKAREEGTDAEDMKFVTRTVINDDLYDPSNYDISQMRLFWPDNNTNASLKQASTVSADGACITIENINTFTGDKNAIMPINGDQANGAYLDQNGHVVVVPDDDLTNTKGIQVSKKKIYLTSDISGGLPSIGYYGNDSIDQINEFVKQASEKSIFPGSIKGWQGSILLELGGMFALPMGGFITLGIFGDWPVFGKTKTIELGKEDESNTKDNKESKDDKSNASSNGWKYDIQEKWSIGGKLGFELPVTEKFSVGLNVGIKYGKFLLSATGSDNKNDESTKNKTYFLKQKSEMTGWTVFPELEFKFFVTKNFFINIFGRYYMSYKLKEKDSNSEELDTKDTSKNNEFPVSCKSLGGLAVGGGIGCAF